MPMPLQSPIVHAMRMRFSTPSTLPPPLWTARAGSACIRHNGALWVSVSALHDGVQKGNVALAWNGSAHVRESPPTRCHLRWG
jgi:hypothetical protein